ncbi:hypothetical protein [Haloglomus litoreum]|uniref:hypothetical protein n=1 Tax=Haloglomus litoreum TaxID=3034026 RepID=UPI0023E7EA80|nr:hypothetical protein [Haloglomus sp. DT116]
MERFVQFVVAGGLTLLGGLWLAEWAARPSAVWVAGVAVALLGCVALAVGIGHELEVGADRGRRR